MKLDKIIKIFGESTLNEDQIKALDEFFETYTKEVKAKAIQESGDMIPKAAAEQAFNNFQEDAEMAFNLLKDDSSKAFSLFQEDAQKAFDLYAGDLQTEYSENMIRGLQELYVDVQERVKADFFESKDAKILDQVKKAMTPLIASTENQALLEEIDKLKSEKSTILNETKEMSRENLINSLVKDFPETYSENVREFISGANDEDEIYERFSTMCEMIDKGVIQESKTPEPSDKKEVVTENVTPEPQKKKKKKKKTKVKAKEVITEELNNLGTVKSKSKLPEIVEEEKEHLFSEEEEALMEIIYS